MMNLPPSIYQRRPMQGMPMQGRPGPAQPPGPGRLAQMNPSTMARLMRSRQPQPAPQSYGGTPTPVVPFQGGQPTGDQGAGGALGGEQGVPGMDMLMKGIEGMIPQGGPGPGPQAAVAPGQAVSSLFPGGGTPPAGGGPPAGVGPEEIAGLVKMLPMLMV